MIHCIEVEPGGALTSAVFLVFRRADQSAGGVISPTAPGGNPGVFTSNAVGCDPPGARHQFGSRNRCAAPSSGVSYLIEDLVIENAML